MTIKPSPEQLAIIDHPADQPLRVSAGAGTGKTTTIVMRLREAIRSGVAPEQALGLTFTNKAAEELSDRLRESLPELRAESREIEVATYHGFAYGVLREFGAYVGVERDVRLIGPGYLRELIHQALAIGNDYAYLDLTAAANRAGEVATLMRQLADNLLTPSAVLATDDAGDPVAAARQELAAVADRVQQAKRRLGAVDYGDLVRLVHELLAGQPAISARIRERYRLVLLDEYQDTDPAQREMLRLLFGGGFPITAVGDSDQTIYEWRGASLANFTDFPRHFPQASGGASATLPLSHNRRSAPPILDLANAIREQLYGEAEFDLLRPATRIDGAVSVARHHSAVDEAVAVAAQVRRLVDEDGLRWRDMAVLFRKNAQIPLLRSAFEAYDIPFEVAALGGLLSVPVVADVRAWLTILDDPAHSPSVLRILLGGSYRLGLADIKPLADWARTTDREDADDAPGRPVLEAIDNLSDIAGLSPEALVRLNRFAAIYRRLLVSAQSLSLVELARRVLDETDAWAEIDALPPNPSLTARLNLYRFLDLAEEWSPLQGRPSLGAFLGYLGTLDEETAAQELDTARIGDENVVALLTIHRAKGLEWDTVFLPAVVKDTLPSGYRGGDNPYLAAAVLPHEVRLDHASLPALTGQEKDDKDALRRRHYNQELRTAYVAVTRAKRRLFISGAHWYTEKRPKSMSPVMGAALALPNVVVTTMVDRPGKAPQSLQIESPHGGPDPTFSGGWEAALRAVAADPSATAEFVTDAVAYDVAVSNTERMLGSLPQPAPDDQGPGPPATSVTGLVVLAGCPQQFYWSEVDPLPRRNSSAMRRGVAVHRMIELHALGQIPLWEQTEDLYDDVSEPMAAGAKPFDAFRASRFGERRARFVEVPIELALDNGRVRGRIDAVYEDEPGTWEIVDWKSGAAPEDPPQLVQLQAYAVAAAEGLIGDQIPAALRVTYCYLGGTAAEEFTYSVTPEWLEQARRDLEQAMLAAAGPDYPQHPGARCRSCDFSRFCPAGTAWLANQS